MISVQQEDFDYAHEYQWLRQQAPGKTGAIVCFSGLVREFGDRPDVHTIELEHYPGMTEKTLERLVEQAKQKWPINATRIIHRIGRLSLDEQIVFVGVASAHRQAAFEASQYLMDYLKTDAPFWKKEVSDTESLWVASKSSDANQAKRWESPSKK